MDGTHAEESAHAPEGLALVAFDVELQESELRVGVAQSALLIPSVVLMLAGGAVADRVHRSRLLTRLHALGSLIALGLSLALFSGWLSYPLLLVYAVTFGALQAFVNPTRDALLSEVAGADIARPVAVMNLTQWGSQAAGALIASGARTFGAPPFFALQSLVLAIGTVAFSRVESSPPVATPAMSFSHLLGGIREVRRSPELLATWVLACAVGVLFIGPFMVVFPLMVRDVYLHGAGEIALVSASFPLGTITGSVFVMRRGGRRHHRCTQLKLRRLAKAKRHRGRGEGDRLPADRRLERLQQRVALELLIASVRVRVGRALAIQRVMKLVEPRLLRPMSVLGLDQLLLGL